MMGESPESGPHMMNIDDLLRIAMERRASDLHLKVGNYPHLRIDGELVPLTDHSRVSAEDMLTMSFSMMSARQKQKFKETTEIDMAYGVAGLGRFRVNVFQQRGNVGLVLRVIPTKIRALDELFLPKVVEQICDMPRGLVPVSYTHLRPHPEGSNPPSLAPSRFRRHQS